MIKRVNFTGRKRIPRTLVDIAVYDGSPRTFDARLDLASLDLPDDSAVYLEAMCAGSNAVQRFDFGKVSAITPPVAPKLSDIDGENVFFTLKVVDTTQRFGRILGIAENVRPERAGEQTATGRKGILPIEERDLGQELWRLEFRQADVFLLVNKNMTGMVDRICSDPGVYSVIYPAVVRSVLQRAIAENGDIEDEDDNWKKLWLQFGKKLHPELAPPPGAEDAAEDIDEWVDEVVNSFCTEHRLLDKFALVENGDGGEDL